MSRNITFAFGEFYHLYNRGTEKRNIFIRKIDYERFLALLYVANGEYPVRIADLQKLTTSSNAPRTNFSQGRFSQGRTLRLFEFLDESYRGSQLVDIAAYCLMPNHFHLLVRELTDGGVSKFMQKLLTAYTMYFNTQYNRTGALFQGKFKATHALDDRYLAYLISYIHLNPVKLIESRWKETGIKNRIGALHHLEKYQYSSFPDYLGQSRPHEMIINKEALPAYCTSSLEYTQAIKVWLDYRKSIP